MTHKHPTCFFLPNGMIWRGAWESCVYHEETVVEHKGAPYVCYIKDKRVYSINTDLSIDPCHNSDQWRLLDPKDYIETEWEPMFYKEGSVVKYNDASHVCIRQDNNAAPPSHNETWVKWNFSYQGYYEPRIYKPYDLVKYRDQKYECIKPATVEVPNQSSHWRLVEDLKKTYISKWRKMIYEKFDVVIYKNRYYICKQKTSTDDPTNSAFWELLPENTNWLGTWEPRLYPMNTVVRDHQNNLFVSRKNATTQPLLNAEFWCPLSHINWCSKWIHQDYRAGDFVIYRGEAYICIRDTVNNNHPADKNFWFLFYRGGVEFDDCYNHRNALSIDIPFDQELTISSTSGGYYWTISPEKYLGYEIVKASDMSENLQPFFKKHSINGEISLVYMLSEWHIGTYEPPNGEPERFYGAVIDFHLMPPGMDIRKCVDKLKDGTLGSDALISVPNYSTGGNYRVYKQWRASELAFVAQPDYMDFLVLYNKKPPEYITKLFKDATQNIQAAQRVKMDKDTFEDQMRKSISQEAFVLSEQRRKNQEEKVGGKFIPITYEAYVDLQYLEWFELAKKLQTAYLAEGNDLYVKAEAKRQSQIRERFADLKRKTHEIEHLVDEKVQNHIGAELWLKNKGTKSGKKYYSSITWNIKNRHYSLVDLDKKHEKIQSLWRDYEKCVPGYKSFLLGTIERKLKVALEIFPPKQRKNNRGQKRRGRRNGKK